ncbi:hypothetical protein [Pseudophaeobacter sp.]|uniref:hypothetical protein n=1 Tax=Pseudophaeobacter sp. TaxID=1971739 RepID=UPI004059FE13
MDFVHFSRGLDAGYGRIAANLMHVGNSFELFYLALKPEGAEPGEDGLRGIPGVN